MNRTAHAAAGCSQGNAVLPWKHVSPPGPAPCPPCRCTVDNHVPGWPRSWCRSQGRGSAQAAPIRPVGTAAWTPAGLHKPYTWPCLLCQWGMAVSGTFLPVCSSGICTSHSRIASATHLALLLGQSQSHHIVSARPRDPGAAARAHHLLVHGPGPLPPRGPGRARQRPQPQHPPVSLAWGPGAAARC